jgi:hypothetical protein
VIVCFYNPLHRTGLWLLLAADEFALEIDTRV